MGLGIPPLVLAERHSGHQIPFANKRTQPETTSIRRGQNFRQAQSTRTAKFDPRTCAHENAHGSVHEATEMPTKVEALSV